ncbi:hypothetical protein EV426DRAFT_235503 [Tirmania nivea]|nr:hypothetical protein EV426DRAFT_235503 [Tirmania nivea]
MSTPVVKRQNTISGFKSRIPVACGLHGPASNKPFISAALGGLTGGTKSKIPVPKNQMKNTKRQTLYSLAHSNAGQIILTSARDPEIQTHGTTVFDSKIPHYSIKQSRALNTESQTALFEGRIKGIKTSIQSSPLFYKTTVSTTMKPHLNEDARPTTRVIVTSKLSLPTRQFTHVMADNTVQTRKIFLPAGQSPSVISNNSLVTRKPSPPTGQSTPIMRDNSVETRKVSPSNLQSAFVTSKEATTTTQCDPGVLLSRL